MKRAIYTGSFDPVTYGHLDVIGRSSCMVDELIVAVLKNSAKTPLFSVEERVKMLKEVTKDMPNVSVTSFEGLTIDFADAMDARIIVRGLRAITDFEYELQMAHTNRIVNPKVDTMFFGNQRGIFIFELHNLKRNCQIRGSFRPFCSAMYY